MSCPHGEHNFEPRYSTTPAGDGKPQAGDFMHDLERFLALRCEVTYVCDVCVKCGKTVKGD